MSPPMRTVLTSGASRDEPRHPVDEPLRLSVGSGGRAVKLRGDVLAGASIRCGGLRSIEAGTMHDAAVRNRPIALQASPQSGFRNEVAGHPPSTLLLPPSPAHPDAGEDVSSEPDTPRNGVVLTRPLTGLSPAHPTHAETRVDVSCSLAPRIGADGYGLGPAGEPAHRAAYREAHGPIPAGADIHHRCGNRGCIEPLHLVALTRREHLVAHVWPALRRWRASRTSAEEH